MNRGPPSPVHGRGARGLAVLVGALVAGSFAGGLALAALTVSGGSETGMGWTESASAATWWRLQSTAVDSIPGSPPGGVSSNMTIPTNLPSTNSSFVLGPSTAGHGAVRFDFLEKLAPGATEFELSVVVVNATGVETAATVFLQTQFPAPTGSFAFSFYLDVGANPAAFGSVTEIAQECVIHASCP